MGRRVAVLVALAGAVLLTLLGSVSAFAGPIETPEPAGRKGRAVLAATGLNLTWPIIIGLSLLLLGTALVAWVALRGGRAGRNHR